MEDRKGCALEFVVVVLVVVSDIVDVAVIVVIASCWTHVRMRYTSCSKGLPCARAEVL